MHKVTITRIYAKRIKIRIFLPLALALLMVSTFGCAGHSVRPVASSQHGAIVGNIKVPDGVRGLILYKYGKVYVPPFSTPPTAYIDANGNFIFENLTPGKYFLSSWVGGPGGNTRYLITSNRAQLEQMLNQVKPGRIVYIGSFWSKILKRPFFTSGKFTLDRVTAPSEKTILKELEPQLKGTGWDQRIRERLKQL